MIQRIQTVYLLIVVLLSGLTFFSPVAEFTTDIYTYLLSYRGVYQLGMPSAPLTFTWPLTLLAATIPLLTLIVVFLYKKRLLQIRLLVADMVLLIGYYAIYSITAWNAKEVLMAEYHLLFVVSFPLINLILCYLSIRAIGRDEALVRSLDRLR